MKLILTSIIVFLGLPVLANGITDWQLGFHENQVANRLYRLQVLANLKIL